VHSAEVSLSDSVVISDSQVSTYLIVKSLPDRPGLKPRSVHNWGLATMAVCECDQQQTVNHVVDLC